MLGTQSHPSVVTFEAAFTYWHEYYLTSGFGEQKMLTSDFKI